MKRLEDIPKKNIFEAPDGYFDRLPSVIQARVVQESASRKAAWIVSGVRYAIPALLIVVIIITTWRLNSGNTKIQDPEEMLAAIDTPSLVAYLEDTDVTIDELLESVTLSQDDVMEIENEVYEITLEEGDLDALLDEYTFDLNN